MIRTLLTGAIALTLASQAYAQVGTAGQYGANQNFRRGYYREPWFGQPTVRQQLNLTDDQYNRLNQAYGTAYQKLDQSYTNGATLSEQERAARQADWYNDFHRNLDTSSQTVLTPEQRSRYNQLWTQYRGYDALLDPTVRQRLNLTDAQVQQLRQYDTQYQQQMGTLLNQYGTNRDAATNGYTKMQPQVTRNINDVLTEAQRQQWSQMYGTAHQFEPFYGYTPGPPKAIK